MKVEILCNNAGIASEGSAVDMATEEVDNIILVNCLNYSKLAQLYGRDMKQRRRGRILMVSSMAGLCSANPNVAVYGATKAFGKSLALAMAKELEIYGVGVTCLLPGAVKNTNFRESTPSSLCWRIPFYARPADIVAHHGVMSLFDGDSQVIPGFQNRLFANVVRPVIPQRFEIMCVQAAFGPFRFPRIMRRTKDANVEPRSNMNTFEQPKSLSSSASPSKQKSSLMNTNVEPRYLVHSPPRVLKIPDPMEHDEGSLSLIEVKEPEEGNAREPYDATKNLTSKELCLPQKAGENATICPLVPLEEDVSPSKLDGENLERSSEAGVSASSSPPQEKSEHIANKKKEVDDTKTAEEATADTTAECASRSKSNKNGANNFQTLEREPDHIQGSAVNVKGGDTSMMYQSSSFVDDDEDDHILSPSLGPIDIMDHRSKF
jgi:hypothetical protein